MTPVSGYERSPRQERVHELVQEFREKLSKQEYDIPTETEGVVVLSAAPDFVDGERIEKSAENIIRISTAVELVKEITAKRLGKDVDDVTIDDCVASGPRIIFNGGHTQYEMFEEVLSQTGYPADQAEIINCGFEGQANTKTNFQVMAHHPAWQAAKHLTYVTNAYHVPRVSRTAAAILPPDMAFDIVGVSQERHPIDVFRKVRGEVKRIIAYSDQGDIAP